MDHEELMRKHLDMAEKERKNFAELNRKSLEEMIQQYRDLKADFQRGELTQEQFDEVARVMQTDLMNRIMINEDEALLLKQARKDLGLDEEGG